MTEEILERYQRYLREGERSRATVEKYIRDVRKLAEYMQPTGKRESDKELVLEYKQHLNKRYKTTSVNSMLAAINSFFDYLRCGECRVKPSRIQRVQYCETEEGLTEKDYERLIRAAERKGDVRMSMLLQIIGSTGIRISEPRFITVEALEAGRADTYNKGKSRVALLPVELVKVLKKHCRKVGIESRSTFITRNGKPMDRGNISKRMKVLGGGARVGTAKVLPHSFRHLFIGAFYNIEKDVVRLMDLLGHSNISTTRAYTMSTEEQPRRQMSRMRMVLSSFI